MNTNTSRARRLAEPISLEDHVQGRFDAHITLVQYGDYECPYTRLSRLSVHALQREYADRLRFVFRHFPLVDIHPHARHAATAAEAADAQGEFWRMHEFLFAHQKALEAADLPRYAAELGLDRDRFERDRLTRETAARIARDLASGERSGVDGTPTFFVNSLRHVAPYTVESLRAAIESALERKPGPAC
jgi:protein-disulfide isomerase